MNLDSRVPWIVLGFFLVSTQAGYSETPSWINTGYYKKAMDQVLEHWPPKSPEPLIEHQQMLVKAWEAEGDPYYVGVQKEMEIAAPIETVDKVIMDFGRYLELFPEFKDMHVISQQGNEVLTSWERPIPIPFVPNVRYLTAYTLDRTNPNRKVYRIKLKESNRVVISDDLIVIEKKSDTVTRFDAFSFFEADWGPAIIFVGLGRVWKDSIEGCSLSDLSVKLRAEHLDWNSERIQKERVAYMPRSLVEAAYEKKTPFSLPQIITK